MIIFGVRNDEVRVFFEVWGKMCLMMRMPFPKLGKSVHVSYGENILVRQESEDIYK